MSLQLLKLNENLKSKCVVSIDLCKRRRKMYMLIALPDKLRLDSVFKLHSKTKTGKGTGK